MDADPKHESLVSLVVPAYNEEETLRPLCASLQTVLDRLGRAYELLFIDDGNTDRSQDGLQALAEQDQRVCIITLRANLGKAMALAAGFRRARGDVIVTLDADLQLWLLGDRPIGTRPLLFFGILLLLVGVQCVFFGLLAEFLLHLHLRADDRYLDDAIATRKEDGREGPLV